MKLSQVLLGASRLPLTPKRGNKDFYKGTGQSYVPGGGHRTGPPGKHVVGGKAKFRLMDDKVRYFVGPGSEVLENSDLRPYVSLLHKPAREPRFNATTPHIPFSPNVTHAPIHTTHITTGQPIKIAKHDHKAFSAWYQSLGHAQKTQVIAETRRDWYIKMVEKQSEQRSARMEALKKDAEDIAADAVVKE